MSVAPRSAEETMGMTVAEVAAWQKEFWQSQEPIYPPNPPIPPMVVTVWGTAQEARGQRWISEDWVEGELQVPRGSPSPFEREIWNVLRGLESRVEDDLYRVERELRRQERKQDEKQPPIVHYDGRPYHYGGAQAGDCVAPGMGLAIGWRLCGGRSRHYPPLDWSPDGRF